MSFAPGDLVMTFEPTGASVNWDGLRPGLVGVVLSLPYALPTKPGATHWCDVVDIRFPHITSHCAVLLLKKIQPPPEDDVELTEEELAV